MSPSVYTSILEGITIAGAAVQQAQPALAQYGPDHIAGTQALLTSAANAYAQTASPQDGTDAKAAATAASALVPEVFMLFGWIKRHLPIAKAAAAPATK
jgi:hypothetical protein